MTNAAHQEARGKTTSISSITGEIFNRREDCVNNIEISISPPGYELCCLKNQWNHIELYQALILTTLEPQSTRIGDETGSEIGVGSSGVNEGHSASAIGRDAGDEELDNNMANGVD